MLNPITVNLGGEGEIAGAINQQGLWVLLPDWASARQGKSLQMLLLDGHRFVISDNRWLPFGDDSVDIVYTNGVPIDGRDTWLGPPVQSSEIRRILKPTGKWFRDSVCYFEKP